MERVAHEDDDDDVDSLRDDYSSSDYLDDDEELDASEHYSTDSAGTTASMMSHHLPKVPRSFICPLTMEIIYDPVLDAEGNTYERSALLQWLKEHRTSPISRQPLNARMIVPNNALRDAIHEVMGDKWVTRKMQEQSVLLSSAGLAVTESSEYSRYRAKIDCYLQSTSRKMGGLHLRLNSQGCCAFRYDNITFVLDVPEKVGVFCLYTRELVSQLTETTKDRILELNFLQGDTRGGCLSAKKHEDGKAEVLFSYTDRVSEVSAQDFCNILLNFVETAVSLRSKLVAEDFSAQSRAVGTSCMSARGNSTPVME
jgi:hypothetical protein